MEDLSPLPPFHRAPLGIGQILDGSLKLYRHHLALLLGMIFGVYLLTFAITKVLESSSGVSLEQLWQLLQSINASNARDYLAIMSGLIVRMLPIILLMTLITYVLYTVGNGLVIQAADNIYKFGRPGTWGEVFGRLVPRLPQLILTVLLRDAIVFLPLMLPVMIGMVSLIPGMGATAIMGIGCVSILLFAGAVGLAAFVNLMLSLVPIIVISEGHSFMVAVRRSWQLLRLKDQTAMPKGQLYRMGIIMSVFWVFILLIIVGMVMLPLALNPERIGEMMEGKVRDPESLWSSIFMELGILALSALIAAPKLVAFVILFFDIRMRHEGYDIGRLAFAAAVPLLPPEPLTPPESYATGQN